MRAISIYNQDMQTRQEFKIFLRMAAERAHFEAALSMDRMQTFQGAPAMALRT